MKLWNLFDSRTIHNSNFKNLALSTVQLVLFNEVVRKLFLSLTKFLNFDLRKNPLLLCITNVMSLRKKSSILNKETHDQFHPE